MKRKMQVHTTTHMQKQNYTAPISSHLIRVGSPNNKQNVLFQICNTNKRSHLLTINWCITHVDATVQRFVHN